MYTLKKTFRFEASHQLPNHDGKCRRLHGHSWKMSVLVTGERLVENGPSQGMLVDFSHISQLVKPIVENKLDHYHLNESLGLTNPTSEEVARWVFNELNKSWPFTGATLLAVTVDETCTSACTYHGEQR